MSVGGDDPKVVRTRDGVIPNPNRPCVVSAENLDRHFAKVGDILLQLINERESDDLHLSLKGEADPVQSCLLAAHSDLIRSIVENHDPPIEVELPGDRFSAEGVRKAVDFAYQGYFCITPQGLQSVLMTAYLLEMPSMIRLLEDYLDKLSQNPEQSTLSLRVAYEFPIPGPLRRKILSRFIQFSSAQRENDTGTEKSLEIVDSILTDWIKERNQDFQLKEEVYEQLLNEMPQPENNQKNETQQNSGNERSEQVRKGWDLEVAPVKLRSASSGLVEKPKRNEAPKIGWKVSLTSEPLR